MAEEKRISTEEHTNESSTEEQAQAKEEADAIAQGFNNARQELNEILERIRGEFQKLDAREARSQFARWVSENPELAMLIAVGSGALLGRLMAQLFRPKPPPPLSVRVRQQGERLAQEARKLAEMKGSEWGQRAQEMSKEMTKLADEWGQVAAERGDFWRRRAGEMAAVYGERAAEYGEEAARRAQKTLSEVAKEAGAAADRASKEAEPRLRKLQQSASDTSRRARRRAQEASASARGSLSDGSSSRSTAANVARGVVAAIALRKGVQWIGRAVRR